MQQEMFRLKRMLSVTALGAILALTAAAQSASTTITETPGNHSRDTTITGANGKTATLQEQASWGNGSYANTRSVTGFNGLSSNYENSRSWGNGAYSNTRTYTGVNGGTRTETVARSGGLVTNTVTGRHGNSRTFTRPARHRR